MDVILVIEHYFCIQMMLEQDVTPVTELYKSIQMTQELIAMFVPPIFIIQMMLEMDV